MAQQAKRREEAVRLMVSVAVFWILVMTRMVGISYNPVLGEIFRCRFEYKDGSSGFYVAEQGTLFSIATCAANRTTVTLFHQFPIILQSLPTST